MTGQANHDDKGIDRRSLLKCSGIITVSASVSGCLSIIDGGGEGDDGGSDDGSDGGSDDGAGGDGGDGTEDTSALSFQDEGFEDEEMRPWEVNHEEFKRTSVVSHSGNFSAGIKASGGVEEIARTDISSESDGVQVSRIEYYWWETRGSNGCATRFLNSDGNVEIGVGTGNPDWKIYDQTGLSRSVGSANSPYKVWVQTVLEFDWESGFVTVTLQDPNEEENNYTNEHPLGEGTDIQTIQLHGFEGEDWQSSPDMNWDDFIVEL